MSTPGQPRHWSFRILPYTTVLLLIAIAYALYIWYSRREATRAMQQRIEQQQQQSQSRPLPPEYLSDHAKILSFTISPGAIHRGQSADLCYGTLNAKTITFDPPLAGAAPGSSHCLAIQPKQTTTYKLTAQAADGTSDTQSLTIVVR
jgi:hypothetical protein